MRDGDPKAGFTIKEDRSSIAQTATEDLAVILSHLPGNGAEDDVSRLMELYEAGERSYRAGVQASAPRVGSSASTNNG